MSRTATLCLALLLATAAGADDDPIARAQALVDQGQPNAAYDLLLPLESTHAGEPAFDYLFGIAALDAGHALQAVFALERVVDARPEDGPARGELARAYLALGETDDARDEFARVEEMDLPPEARQTIERYMSSIELFHDRTRTRYRPWIEIGAGFDTNVNGATDDRSVQVSIPGLGVLPLTLSGTQDSPVYRLGAGVRFTSPLDVERGLSLFGRIGLDHRVPLNQPDFKSLGGNGQFGVQLRRDAHQFSLALEGDITKVDGAQSGVRNNRSNRESAGALAQWQYAVSETDQITSFLQYSFVHYPDQGIRNVNRMTGGLGWGHVFKSLPGTPIVFGSFFAGFEDPKSDARGPHFGRDLYGMRGGASYQFSERQTLYGAVTYQRSNYDAAFPLFNRRRDDDFVDINIGYRHQFDEHWSVTPTLTYSNNDSNIVVTDYDRLEAMVTLRNDF
ncbi:MAG: tetratricopeptide repeat protein [Gammaproteobacteria bacterium]